MSAVVWSGVLWEGCWTVALRRLGLIFYSQVMQKMEGATITMSVSSFVKRLNGVWACEGNW
jgi:hypothetical protein